MDAVAVAAAAAAAAAAGLKMRKLCSSTRSSSVWS